VWTEASWRDHPIESWVGNRWNTGCSTKTKKDVTHEHKHWIGWWYTYPSEKYESELGWFFPTEWKVMKAMFQTTNQWTFTRTDWFNEKELESIGKLAATFWSWSNNNGNSSGKNEDFNRKTEMYVVSYFEINGKLFLYRSLAQHLGPRKTRLISLKTSKTSGKVMLRVNKNEGESNLVSG